MSIQNNKNWLLKTLPIPTWAPIRWDVVFHKKTKRKVLVLSTPKAPDDINDITDIMSLKQRPLICDILDGEIQINNVDIVNFAALNKTKSRSKKND
jgi:hypothetical protein